MNKKQRYNQIIKEIQTILSKTERKLLTKKKFIHSEILKCQRIIKKRCEPHSNYTLSNSELEDYKSELKSNIWWREDYKHQLKRLQKLDVCLDFELLPEVLRKRLLKILNERIVKFSFIKELAKKALTMVKENV